MPLSKQRDRDRKRAERASIRLDTGLSTVPVQPTEVYEEVYEPPARPELDADGNPMPDYY